MDDDDDDVVFIGTKKANMKPIRDPYMRYKNYNYFLIITLFYHILKSYGVKGNPKFKIGLN